MRHINWEIIREEIKKNIARNKFITRILILQCTVCLTLIALVVANVISAHNSIDHLKKYIGDKSYYSLHDNADQNGSYQKYRNSKLEYYKLKCFVTELTQNKDIAFINTIIQPIDLVANNIPEKFCFGYEEGDVHKPYIRNHESFVNVKSIQVSENVFSEFGLSVDKGRNFFIKDYVLKDTNGIKAILGSDYTDNYKIGDTFSAAYLSVRMNFEVIGFLPPDTYIPRNGALEYLDRYILIPAFADIDSEKYYDLASIVLLQQANGQIVTSNKNYNVPGLIKDLSNKYSTIQFDVLKVGKKEIVRTIKLSDEIVKKLSLIVFTLIIFTVVGIITSILGRIRENYYRYGVHLMSGAAMSDISYQMIGLILHIIVCALVISLIISTIILGYGPQLIIIIIVASIIFILSSIVPVVVINKLDINYLIRRKE